MAFILTERERKVLKVYAENSDAWLASYNNDVIEAAGGFDDASRIVKGLRRRKLLDVDGRGEHAGFGINDKGRKALEQAHMSNVSETVSESQTPPGPPNPPKPARHRPVG